MARYPRKGRNYRRKAKKVARKGKRMSFEKRVQKVISKNIETKTVVHQSNVTAYNAALNATGDCLRIIPPIANNFTGSALIGNEVRMQSLNIRGTLTFQLGQTTSNKTRIGVRLTILRAKRFDDWNAAATDFGTGGFARLLDVPPTILTGQNLGTLTQFNTPINKDYFSVVSDKRYYMSQSLQSVGTSVASTVYTTKFVNMKIPYSRRKVQFDQNFNNAGEAVNYPYFMLINWAMLDGSSDATPPGSGDTSLTFQYVTTMKYEDA